MEKVCDNPSENVRAEWLDVQICPGSHRPVSSKDGCPALSWSRVEKSFAVEGGGGGVEDMFGNDGARFKNTTCLVPHNGEIAVRLPHPLG